VLLLLQVALTPAQNVVSRHVEAEADWVALQTTRDPASGRGLFEKFQETSLAQPNPPTWDYLFLETHPTIMQRIAMAEAWKDRERP
jgi:STE24 endopeptidase